MFLSRNKGIISSKVFQLKTNIKIDDVNLLYLVLYHPPSHAGSALGVYVKAMHTTLFVFN